MLQIRYLIIAALLVPVLLFSQQKKGWLNLFDGKSLAGWTKVAGQAEYMVEQGAITGISKQGTPNTFLITDKTYGDFILELDVLIEDSTTNSGIQFRSHYDAAGNGGKGQVYGFQYELDPSMRRWTGGIYEEGRRGWQYPLTLNESAGYAFKKNVYNSVRIEAIGPIIKTWINNKPASYVIDSTNKDGIIALQVHSIGNPGQANKKIRWKNIRIKTTGLKSTPFPADVFIVNNIPNNLSDEERATGYTLLYDGVTSAKWRSANGSAFPAKGWAYNAGLLQVLPAQDPSKHRGEGGDIVTIKKYAAFDLSLEYNISPGGNSGLKYFVTNEKGSSLGLEFQVLDDALNADAKAGKDGNHKSAALYDIMPAAKNARFENPAGQWNKIRLVVYPDNRVEHYLNGMKVVTYIKGSNEFTALIALSKYSTIKGFAENTEGHLLLQDHGHAVSFRSIKIKPL